MQIFRFIFCSAVFGECSGGVGRWFPSRQSVPFLLGALPSPGSPDCLEDGALPSSLAGLSAVEAAGLTSPNRTSDLAGAGWAP